MKLAAIQLCSGVDISENGQAMRALEEVGPGGHFLGCEHTQANFKDAFWRTNVLDYKPFEQWSEEGAKDSVQLAHERVQSELSNYQKPAMDPGIEEELNRFVQEKKASEPDAFA